MTVAVVIPALDEAAQLPRTLSHTRRLGFDRLLVVDGGSADRTPEIVRELASPPTPARSPAPGPPCSVPGPQSSLPPLSLLTSAPGRARQMNAGAAATSEDVVLFLHADTLLPESARAAIVAALSDATCVGGRFDVRFERDRGWAWLIARLISWRSRWSGIATGDQAIFVRRAAFEQLRGFEEVPLMEDVGLTRRLKRLGRTAALREQVVTSFRRWERCGPVRTMLLMWALRFLYWAGMSPHRLARFYRNVR